MKKSKSPSPVSPAPATKSRPPAPAVKPAAAPAKASPRRKPAPAVSPAPAAEMAPPRPAAAAPAPVPPAVRRPVVTTITARINVGFGNALHLRGDGPGLSWQRGLPMECIAADLWRINLGESPRPFVFKVLVNDLSWNTGPDYTVASGGVVNVTPVFA